MACPLCSAFGGGGGGSQSTRSSAYLQTLQQSWEDWPVHKAVCPGGLAVHYVQQKLHGLNSCLHSTQAVLDLLYQHLKKSHGGFQKATRQHHCETPCIFQYMPVAHCKTPVIFQYMPIAHCKTPIIFQYMPIAHCKTPGFFQYMPIADSHLLLQVQQRCQTNKNTFFSDHPKNQSG